MMDIDENGCFVIDEDDLFEYISEKLDIDEVTIAAVLDAEMDYLANKGFVNERMPSDQAEPPLTMDVTIDSDLLVAHVASVTEFSLEMVARILNTEMQYFEEHGIVN